jgi:hypothetical protein
LQKLGNWFERLGNSLRDRGITELSLDELSYETPDVGLGKVSATIKTFMGKRQQIRRQVEQCADSLIEILNQFICKAVGETGTDRLVLIVDNLDRIVEKLDGEPRRSNYEQIFVNHSDQLWALDCHIVYTGRCCIKRSCGRERDGRF